MVSIYLNKEAWRCQLQKAHPPLYEVSSSTKLQCFAGEPLRLPQLQGLLVSVPSGVAVAVALQRLGLRCVWFRSSSMVAVTHDCVMVVSQPSCSLCAAYRKSPMTVHLVLSQSLLMCFNPATQSAAHEAISWVNQAQERNRRYCGSSQQAAGNTARVTFAQCLSFCV